MIKYTKIENKESKICSVGLGTNEDFYKSIGMTPMDVEQAYDGNWYLAGYAPQKPLDVAKSEKLAEIKAYFEEEIAEKATITMPDGFVIDARRVDADNVAKLIKVYDEPIIYIGYNTARPNTDLAYLQDIEIAIIKYGQYLYMRKWEQEKAVNAATTLEDINAIIIGEAND